MVAQRSATMNLRNLMLYLLMHHITWYWIA